MKTYIVWTRLLHEALCTPVMHTGENFRTASLGCLDCTNLKAQARRKMTHENGTNVKFRGIWHDQSVRNSSDIFAIKARPLCQIAYRCRFYQKYGTPNLSGMPRKRSANVHSHKA